MAHERVQRTDDDEVEVDVESAELLQDGQARHVRLVPGAGAPPRQLERGVSPL